MIIPIIIGAFGTVTKGLLKGLEDLEVGGRDHPNYSIDENGQNTEKSPGDLRRLAVIQNPMKDHQLQQMVKNSKRVTMIIMTLRSIRILRRVLETWGDLMSLKLQ